ncbi:MAG: hypothetical protein AAB421_03800 [Patescibacteria group bacterium]
MAAFQLSSGTHILAALSFAILLGAVGVQLGQAARAPITTTTRPLLLNERSYIKEADTDKDGLPDWQESLIGTDPKKADSDGDGTNDSYTSATPVDYSLFDKNASSTEDEPETLTDTIGRRLIEQYVYLKHDGIYTNSQGDRIATDLSRYFRTRTEFTPYTADALTITKNSSADAIEKHRKRMQVALESFLDLGEPEFVLYGRYIEDKNTTALEELAKRAGIYQRVASAVMAVPVPQEMASVHLEVANSLAFFGTVLEVMVLKAEDPIASIALLKTYTEAEHYVHATFAGLNTFYNRKREESGGEPFTFFERRNYMPAPFLGGGEYTQRGATGSGRTL